MRKIPALFKILKYGTSLQKMGLSSAAESSRILVSTLLESLVESLEKLPPREESLELVHLVSKNPDFRVSDEYVRLTQDEKDKVDNMFKLLSSLVVSTTEGAENLGKNDLTSVVDWYFSVKGKIQGAALAASFLDRFFPKP